MNNCPLELAKLTAGKEQRSRMQSQQQGGEPNRPPGATLSQQQPVAGPSGLNGPKIQPGVPQSDQQAQLDDKVINTFSLLPDAAGQSTVSQQTLAHGSLSLSQLTLLEDW